MIEIEDGDLVVGEVFMGIAVLLFTSGVSSAIWGAVKLVKRVRGTA